MQYNVPQIRLVAYKYKKNIMTALEYLRNNIEESNIPKEHYEWEIAEMMEGYAYEYHQKQLILSGVVSSKFLCGNQKRHPLKRCKEQCSWCEGNE
jgi:hypothetical protein